MSKGAEIKTKVERELLAKEEAHASDPERAEVLRCARAFKHSWVELGEALAKVRREERWSVWGHGSFDDYVKKELHLRPDTADKLTASFLFLRAKAPAVLARDGVREPLPSFQSVDFLRRAEETEDAPRDVVDEIRKRVLDDGVPARTLAKTYGEQVFPVDPETRRSRDLAGLRNVAARLRTLLGEAGGVVPARLAREVDGALERLLVAIAEEDAA